MGLSTEHTEISGFFPPALNPGVGSVFARQQLLDKVWETGYEPGTVNKHILEIRRQIEDDALNPYYVLTIYGQGYTFRDKQGGL